MIQDKLEAANSWQFLTAENIPISLFIYMIILYIAIKLYISNLLV